MPIIALNKRVAFDYEILETYEAGIALSGTEVKSVKTGHINLQGAFVVVKDGQAWLLNGHIPPYQVLNAPESYDPDRSRKLLLHKHELQQLIGKTSQKGLTLLPLKVYTVRGLVKVEIGMARHRKKHDKREVLKQRTAQREMQRATS